MLEHVVVSQAEMDAWPVDQQRSGEKRWAEIAWGGDKPGRRKLFNWNIWPCRIVFAVSRAGDVARGEAVWRRSSRSIRMKGLKLLSAATKEEIADARLLHYDQERVVIEFRPVAGPGVYHLYYGAAEPAFFEPSRSWLLAAETSVAPVAAAAKRIEARCALDSFYPMETIALKSEVDDLLARFPCASYLVFPEDRDHPIKLNLEIPAHWARQGPRTEIELAADRNEYRVFELGIWACRQGAPDLTVTCTDLRSEHGVIPGARIQCLTLESRSKAAYVRNPAGPFALPKVQVRALWFGVDIPEDAAGGAYTGAVTVQPAGLPATSVPIRLRISEAVVADQGDHELWRLSRLRWLDSSIGLSGGVYPPFAPLRISQEGRAISTWGHTLALNACGLPERLTCGGEDILAAPITLTGNCGGAQLALHDGAFEITQATDARVAWRGAANAGALKLAVDGWMEFDGCAVITLRLDAKDLCAVSDLALSVSWRRRHAELASGMGYRGRRDGDRAWRKIARHAECFTPDLWLGSVDAGLGWMTWDTVPWQDVSRVDAATVTENDDEVVLRLNLGAHDLGPAATWQMTFALRPTPVKPPDPRHWDFRYLHRGGGFEPSDEDTPQSYLRDNCLRLDEVKSLGVKRLNLHDWWGPAFNYPWQWEGPDNLSRLTAEAHKRGILVKVYNSGRELSTLAPEFWALVYEGFRFPDADDPNPRLRFQDAWHENHLPDGLPPGWPRLHRDLGNEHTVGMANDKRTGNFYLEAMRYMTRHFGTDGAYWDGADGSTLAHREMAKRLWTIFQETQPAATIDAHHGDTLLDSPITTYMLCLPFTDSIWHGEGFPYDAFDPWAWLVEISGVPFGVPSEMLSKEQYFARGMLFGIWPRMGWGAGTDRQQALWRFFDRFGIKDARMCGWWQRPAAVVVDRPETLVTAFCHPSNGALLAIATWHPPLAVWLEQKLDVSLQLDRPAMGLPPAALQTTDVLTGEDVDIACPVEISTDLSGRLLWVRAAANSSQ